MKTASFARWIPLNCPTSVLALYHLFSGTPASDLPNVDELLSSLGIETLPEVKHCVLFGQYLDLPRLRNDRVLLASIQQGISMLTWAEDGFAYAQDFDADRNRYVGLCGRRNTQVAAEHTNLVVKAEVAAAQLAVATTAGGTGPATAGPSTGDTASTTTTTAGGGTTSAEPKQVKPTRFYGNVTVDATRLGRDAGRISEEVLSHLASLQGAKAEVTLDIEVRIPDGVPDNVVRTAAIPGEMAEIDQRLTQKAPSFYRTRTCI